MKNLSSLFFIFLFLLMFSISFLPLSAVSDQIVLDKYGSPLILNEQEIILKNNLDGFISWEDFNKKYRLRGINGVWHIVEREEEETIKTDGLPQINLPGVEPYVPPDESMPEEEREDQISDVDLTMMTEDQMNNYIKQLFSPLILALIGAIALIVGISYYTNVYVGSISMMVYLVICTIMKFIPIWVLVFVIFGVSGILAYSLSSAIGGGE